jgi:hypothetical protein
MPKSIPKYRWRSLQTGGRDKCRPNFSSRKSNQHRRSLSEVLSKKLRSRPRTNADGAIPQKPPHSRQEQNEQTGEFGGG